MPSKKQTLKAKFKSWQLTAAVVSSVALIAGGVGVFAYQQYSQAQISAAADAEFAVELAQLRIGEVSAALDDLELAIQNAQEIATQAVGQTLDEKDLEALLAEIEKAKEIWVEKATTLLELEAAVKALKQEIDLTTSSGTSIATLLKSVNDAVSSNWDKIIVQVVSLGEKISSVQVAQALWKEQQEEISAEKVAAEAYAKVGKSVEFAELVAIGRAYGESVIGYRTLEGSKRLASSGVKLNPVKSTSFTPAKGDGLIVVGALR